MSGHEEIVDLQLDSFNLSDSVVGVLRTERHRSLANGQPQEHCVALLRTFDPTCRKLAVANGLAALVRTEGKLQNHKQDDFEGGPAPSLIEHPQASSDPREEWLAAGANDDLAFLMAMLALAEGAGQEELTVRYPPLPTKETIHGRAKDGGGAYLTFSAHRAATEILMISVACGLSFCNCV